VFAALDPGKVQVILDRETNTYTLYSLSTEQKVAFCFYDDARTGGAASAQYESIEMGAVATSRSGCSQSIVDMGVETDAARGRAPLPIFFSGAAARSEASPYCGIFNRFIGTGSSTPPGPGGYPKLELRLYIRSVGEIFQFLGDLLYYQEEVRRYAEDNPQLAMKLNSPVTFGYCPDQPEAGCDDIFLRLDGDPCNARFSLSYRDRTYHVGNYDPPAATGGVDCRPDTTARKDHTLEVLGVLHQLIGLNKSATDIRSTPAVQVLP
jgi:hypothetical protein